MATVRKAASALKITKATRRGRTVTVKGTAARSATGTVTVTAGGVKKRVKLEPRRVVGEVQAPARAAGATVTVSYAGDALHIAATAKKTVK